MYPKEPSRYKEEDYLMLSGIQHFHFAEDSGRSFILNSNGMKI